MANKFLGEAGVKELIDHIPTIDSGSIIDIPNLRKSVLKYSSGLYGNYALIKDVDISFSGSLNNITVKFTKKTGNVAPLLLNGNGIYYRLAAVDDFIDGFKNAAEGEMFYEQKYEVLSSILDICVIINNAETYNINVGNNEYKAFEIPKGATVFATTSYYHEGALSSGNLPAINEKIADVVERYNGSNISTTISSTYLFDYLIDVSTLHLGSVIYFNETIYVIIKKITGIGHGAFIGMPINEISADEVREQFNS